MSKVHPLPANQQAAAQTAPTSPEGPLAYPNEPAPLSGAMTGASTPADGSSPSMPPKALVEAAQLGKEMIFSESRRSAENRRRAHVVNDPSIKFEHELKDLAEFVKNGKRFEELKDMMPELGDLKQDIKRYEKLKKMEADLKQEKDENKVRELSDKIKKYKDKIENCLLEEELKKIHSLESSIPSEGINNRYFKFQNMNAKEFFDYLNLRKDFAELTIIQDQYAKASDLKFMKEKVNIPQLKEVDAKEIKESLEKSIKAIKNLLFKIMHIAEHAKNISISKNKLEGVATASPAFAVGVQDVNNLRDKQIAACARYLLDGDDDNNISAYEEKVKQIRSKYESCCPSGCTMM